MRVIGSQAISTRPLASLLVDAFVVVAMATATLPCIR